MGSRRVRAEKKFCCGIKLICPVQSPLAKIFPFPFDPNHLYIPSHPGPHRGAFRDRHGRRARDAVDAAGQKTNDVARGRRSRVVLTPRRWRQVLEKQASCKFLGDDGGKQARSPGRARNKRLKPSRAGMPGDPGATVVTTLVCFLHFAHEAAGATGTRHSPRPLWAKDSCTTRAQCVAGMRRCT